MVDLDAFRARLRSACATRGLEYDDWIISVRQDPATRRTEVSLQQHHAIGLLTETVDLPLDPGMVGDVRMGVALDEIRALLDRDEWLEANGRQSQEPPAWTHVMDAAAHALLVHHGIDPALAGTRMPEEDGPPYLGGAREASLSKVDAAEHGLLDIRGTIRGLRANVVRIETAEFSYRGGRPRIMVPFATETIANCAAGMELRGIISHPALDPLDLRIVDARRNGDGLALHVEPPWVRCAAVPDGVDPPPWLHPAAG